jgi:hypothetical protein
MRSNGCMGYDCGAISEAHFYSVADLLWVGLPLAAVAVVLILLLRSIR